MVRVPAFRGGKLPTGDKSEFAEKLLKVERSSCSSTATADNVVNGYSSKHRGRKAYMKMRKRRKGRKREQQDRKCVKYEPSCSMYSDVSIQTWLHVLQCLPWLHVLQCLHTNVKQNVQQPMRISLHLQRIRRLLYPCP
jgi:hypothetical protein